MKKFDIMRYTVIPIAPAITASDSSPLPPGDYGFYPEGCKPATWGDKRCFTIQPEASFEKSIKIYQEKQLYLGDAMKLYTFPPSVEQSVRLRDKLCFITGASPDMDLDVAWIFPPTWAHLLDVWPDPDTFDFTPFITASNACMMRRDLLTPFHDNVFGIDVDDDYRIVVFRDMGSVTLPSHSPKSQNPACAGPDDEFLRKHFRWCLLANMFGGDIREDYDYQLIFSTMEDLGVSGDECPVAPMNDERWNTVLGKEIWEHVMKEKLYWAEHPPMSPEEGEDEVLQEDAAP